VTNHPYEELPDPSSQILNEKPVKRYQLPKRATQATGSIIAGNVRAVNLAEGTYDEDESRNEFLEALSAFRNADLPASAKSDKKVKFNEVP
jgi:hypothetical protein